ncbi:MAG: hypothetical protein M5U16_16210 [Hyphomicrobium sp.]|nr:hypothetical protein [Hyphomicrobium sp.]
MPRPLGTKVRNLRSISISLPRARAARKKQIRLHDLIAAHETEGVARPPRRRGERRTQISGEPHLVGMAAKAHRG